MRASESNKDFYVFCSSVEEAEKLFDEQVIMSFSDCGFTPILPNELKCSRSVLLRRLDVSIASRDISDIKAEIGRCNSWCSVREIIKIGSTTMKIVFTTSQMAEKCLSIGLSMFFLHIPNRNIEKDTFIKLDTCYSCYAIENHIAANCPKRLSDSNYQLCSQCADTGHTYKNCSKSPEGYKCVNCGGNHHALAMACPIRKSAIKSKRRSFGSESAAYGVKAAAVNQSKSLPLQNQADFCKSISLIFIATLKNAESPGTFSDVLHHLFTNNSLPLLNLKGIEPPTVAAFRTIGSFAANQPMFGSHAESTAQSVVGQVSSCKSPRVKEVVAPGPVPAAQPNSEGCSPPPGHPSLDGVPLSKANVRTTDPDSDIHHEADDAWRNYKVFKPYGSAKLNTVDDLMAAWDAGNTVITRENGSVPDYNTVMSLLSGGSMPKIASVRKSDYQTLCNSPKRCLAKGSRR